MTPASSTDFYAILALSKAVAPNQSKEDTHNLIDWMNVSQDNALFAMAARGRVGLTFENGNMMVMILPTPRRVRRELARGRDG